jgi:hypothetical protein
MAQLPEKFKLSRLSRPQVEALWTQAPLHGVDPGKESPMTDRIPSPTQDHAQASAASKTGIVDPAGLQADAGGTQVTPTSGQAGLVTTAARLIEALEATKRREPGRKP